MAFGQTQLKTFKWLEQLAAKPPRGLKRAYTPSAYEGKILARFGRFYATNGYVMASVEWPEYAHAGDDEWMEVARFLDDAGRLMERIELVPCLGAHGMQRDTMERFFPHPHDFGEGMRRRLTPSVIMQALKGFDVNRLTPGMQFTDRSVMFSANNDEVCIRVVCMLCKD